MDGSFYAVIPAGGSGTRLWPVSRQGRPKFLLPLPGPRTMIQETVHRLAPLADASRVIVITGAKHADEVCRQLPDVPPAHVVVEPVPRGSGPAIGLGAAIVAKRDPQAIMGSFAADHVVTEPAVFENAVRSAIDIARQGYLVTIGIEPSYAETGYGYIRRGATLGTFQDLEICQVDEFKEKPNLATATRYVESGEYLWNASMFVWQARTLLDELRRYLPEVAGALDRIASAWDTPDQQRVFDDVWPTIAEVTIDEGILERSDRVAVVPGHFGWTDLGDWHGFGKVVSASVESLQAAEDEDAPRDTNLALNADLLAVDVRDAVVVGNGRLVALLGLDNVVVIDTDDALLICDRSRAQEVKSLVEELKRRGATALL